MINVAAGWNEQHQKYAQAEWINTPSIFGEWALGYFPSSGSLLDVGCGQGQDSRLFAAKGYDVVGIDFAAEGLRFANEKTPAGLKGKLRFEQADISQPLDFPDESFDVVYSHLAIHYFDAVTTQSIFDEFHRILKKGGTLAVLVNSVHDAEYGTHRKIEDDYFQVGDVKKRYFSADSIRRFARKFEIIIADERGETYKDRAVGNSQLVRLVAKTQ
jgi:SAM-dependent methyltransferase